MTPTTLALVERLVKESARMDDVYDNCNGTLTVKVEWLALFFALAMEHAAGIAERTQEGEDYWNNREPIMGECSAEAIREAGK